MQQARLKIETFERLMLAQDGPTESNTFVFEFKLDGRLDRVRLRCALDRTVMQHPMAAATIDDSVRQWNVNWRAPELLDEIDIFGPLSFDLQSENGIRVALKEAETGSQALIVVVHHACLDALGALQFVDDLAKNYGIKQDPNSAQADSQAEQVIGYLRKYRSSYGGNRVTQVLRWPLDLVIMFWAHEIFLNRPKPIEVSGQESGDCRSGRSRRSTRTKRLEKNDLAQIVAVARSRRQTLNDHLLSSCFLAIAGWFEKFNPENAESLVRVLIPVSLRRGTIKSAANMVAMVNMDKRPGKARTVESFRKVLSVQMRLVKRLRTGVTANRFLGIEHRIFGRWRLFENDARCVATCIVSNLGDISRQIGDQESGEIRFGQDAVVRSIDFIGPIRGKTHLCIHAWTYLDRMSVVGTYNTRELGPHHVDCLLDEFTEILLDSSDE